MEDLFIIMPITTPQNKLAEYDHDEDHFKHVLECLFEPAIKKAGFNPVPPKTAGSEIIQADIINRLSEATLVMCDMSILNPNVFFEFGIRTALDKPVVLVTDDKTVNLPFDTSIINYHQYNSSLKSWVIHEEIEKLAEHIKSSNKKSRTRNALWKYFGIEQTGTFNLDKVTNDDKIDIMMQKIDHLYSLISFIQSKQNKDIKFYSTQSHIPNMTLAKALADLNNAVHCFTPEKLNQMTYDIGDM